MLYRFPYIADNAERRLNFFYLIHHDKTIVYIFTNRNALLTKCFMKNFFSGMFQRLEKFKKNAFASCALFGENNNSTISGTHTEPFSGTHSELFQVPTLNHFRYSY